METVTTVTGDTATVEVTVTEFRSATTEAFGERKKKKKTKKGFLAKGVCICVNA